MNTETTRLGDPLRLARTLRRLQAQVQPGDLGTESLEQFVRRYSRVRAPALDLQLESRYDPSWPEHFEHEKGRLQAALAGADLAAIEHIGSTAVPGLASKNILDIAVAMHTASAAEGLTRALASLGYVAHGESPIAAEFSWHWRVGQEGGTTFVVHTCAAAHPRLAELTNFRDFLRAFPEERQAYVALKRALAEVPHPSWLEYSALKKVLVVQITARANAWRTALPGTTAPDSVIAAECGLA